jgi:hypothetical protein
MGLSLFLNIGFSSEGKLEDLSLFLFAFVDYLLLLLSLQIFNFHFALFVIDKFFGNSKVRIVVELVGVLAEVGDRLMSGGQIQKFDGGHDGWTVSMFHFEYIGRL